MQKGFAILEAMVAIMVFALGILGLVGVQAAMTREQTSSKIRADAAYLASQLIGEMWVDIPNLSQYASGNCNGYTKCADWSNKVAVNLPSGSSTVTVNAANGDVTITVSWTMPGGDAHQYVTATTIAKTDA
ncbi:MAG: pilus assembly protein PilV [Azonexaceae bacterium]|nr:pilus assembly protein PilV [Azonexaceae bacterium]